MVRVTHLSDSPQVSFKFNIALYSGLVLNDDAVSSGELSLVSGPRVQTFLYRNTDSSKPISVSNKATNPTEMYLFYPLLALGLRDQGRGYISVPATDAQSGVWIIQVTALNSQSCRSFSQDPGSFAFSIPPLLQEPTLLQ